MRRYFVILAVSLVFIVAQQGISTPRKTPLPAQGMIPDEVTALKVAEVLFPPIFGSEEVAKFVPYHADLKDGIWTVYGTLKRGSKGGTPQISLQKKDGKVIEVWHSQ